MVITLCAGSPLLELPFVLLIGKTKPLYGPNMVHFKSDVMNISYYIRDHHLAMLRPAFCHKKKQNYYSEYLQT